MPSRLVHSQITRLLITSLAIVACVFGIWFTGRAALAQLLVRAATAFRSPPLANEAVRFNQRDAEAHYARAALMRASGAAPESVAAFEQAVALRPRDYYLWLELGMAREESGDASGALPALNNAVELAPYYAQPRWQRGNLLLRLSRYEEAFSDLRLAANSNPELTPSLLDLAWGVSRNDVALAQQLAGATSPKLQVALALYLARRGHSEKALEVFTSIESVPDEDRRELVKRLIAANAFDEAFRVSAVDPGSAIKGSVYDGGFEGVLSLEEAGFCWRIPPAVSAVQLSQSTEAPHTGSKSLQVDFAGQSGSDWVLLSQLVPVEPGRSYELHFATRSRQLVTGGLPFLKVVDAANTKTLLGSSRPFGTTNETWVTDKFVFTTEPATRAVVLSLERQNCTTSPCPAFGTVWLDSLAIAADTMR
ncbi:MAG TPA: hypothetical protein VJ023_04955 [Pyrinomonadaceae bacterium]|nr:hypothetical protein [Pyrinomonadaceae bacterium]